MQNNNIQNAEIEYINIRIDIVQKDIEVSRLICEHKEIGTDKIEHIIEEFIQIIKKYANAREAQYEINSYKSSILKLIVNNANCINESKKAISLIEGVVCVIKDDSNILYCVQCSDLKINLKTLMIIATNKNAGFEECVKRAKDDIKLKMKLGNFDSDEENIKYISEHEEEFGNDLCVCAKDRLREIVKIELGINPNNDRAIDPEKNKWGCC